MNSLTGILLWFRLHPVALMCDIERMFHSSMLSKQIVITYDFYGGEMEISTHSLNCSA